jgi:hypothetical protein
MRLRNKAAHALNKVNDKLAGPALGFMLVGVVVWPLFPVGLGLGLAVAVIDRAASALSVKKEST